jgi:hypothetical protein
MPQALLDLIVTIENGFESRLPLHVFIGLQVRLLRDLRLISVKKTSVHKAFTMHGLTAQP